MAGQGTIFRVTTNGAFTVLTNFVGTYGANPGATMTLGPDGCLYGSTFGGGLNGKGTVFKVTTNGALTTLVNFSAQTGGNPASPLTFGPDGNLYGTASDGLNGTNLGNVFQLTTNGVLTTLARFVNTNGKQPLTGVTFGPDGNLYGATCYGGPIGAGVIYRLKLRPTLSINRNADGVVTLNVTTMPGATNQLWATTDLSSDWTVLTTNVATNVLFQFMDTNASGAPAKFYRVSAP
jgi:uncharacterized repeat protein (TIGR03803 family)